MYGQQPLAGQIVTGVVYLLLAVGASVGLFLLFRAIALWYFRINEMYEKLNNISEYAYSNWRQNDEMLKALKEIRDKKE